MKKIHLRKTTVALLAQISLLPAAHAQTTYTTSITTGAVGDPPGFTVSNVDLLQTAFGSVNASTLNDRGTSPDTAYLQGLTPNGEESLRDGVWFSDASSRGSAMVENNEFAEYTLDLTASPAGYTINGIDLYSNWGTGDGRNEIKVNISFSLVGTPDTFDQILEFASGNDLFVYNPPAGQTQGKLSVSGFSVAGVAKVRFFWPATQENSAVGYSEIDVFGISSGADSIAPLLESTTPAAGATGIATISDLVVTFNEDIRKGSGIVSLRLASDDSLVEDFNVATSGQVTVLDRKFTVNPTNSLIIGTEYYLVIPSGAVEDLAGNPFGGILAPPDAGAFSFTTDDVPPTLVLSGETLVNAVPTNDLTIRFDENIQFTTGQITIFLADGSPVETIEVDGGAVTINGNIATIDISDLAFGTGYYVNITAGAFTDLSGNALAAVTDDTTIAFTTAPSLFIHHWEFESDPPVDLIGTHDGTVGSNVTFTTGTIGQAAMFAGGNSRITVGKPSLPATNFTFACWVNRDDVGGNNVIAGTRDADQSGAFLSLNGTAGTPVLTLQTNGTAVKLTATQNVTAGEWTHLAFTVDEVNGATIYVNGTPAGTEAAGTGHTVLSNFLFGRRPDILGIDPYEGLIDDARIYAEVLSQSAIETLAGMTGPLVVKISQSGGNLDFEWNSMDGMQYDLLSSTDLSAPISTWPVYNDGVNPPYENIPSGGIATTLSGVVKLGQTRFFALFEEEAPPLLSENFESAAAIPAGWVAADNGNGTAWEAGPPTLGIPEAAANGLNCAGTNLGGFYGSNADVSLTSPSFAAPAGGATLSFQRFIDTEGAAGDGGPDFGTVRILDADNADAEIVGGDFPITAIEGIELGWDELSFPIPAAALGKNIKIQFQFVSNGSSDFSGFYIDDVTVTR